MVFSSYLTFATFILVIVVARFKSWDQFFFSFFKSFQSLGLGVRVSIKVGISVGLGLGLGLGFTVPFTFSRFLSSLLHSHHALLSCYRWRINKVSNIMIHRHTVATA